MRAALAVPFAILPVCAVAGSLPPGFSYLRAIDPTIRQDIRYAGLDNFTGAPLPGYDARECILRTRAAEALKAVKADLARDGYGLKVFDCYRPKRAVAAMAKWAGDGRSPGDEKRYFPDLEKSKLHALGYIAKKSAHSTGIAVDLTMIRLEAPASASPRLGPCTGSAAGRSATDEVDMGTGFDCFDERSRTASPAISPDQAEARRRLVAAMARHGFSNYAGEWWHFTFNAEKPPAHDFPVAPIPTAP